MSKTNGGMAFPRGVSSMPDGRGGTTTAKPADGMTLRDYFAAKAMQAFITGSMADGTKFNKENDPEGVSFVAFLIADAMLKARSAE